VALARAAVLSLLIVLPSGASAQTHAAAAGAHADPVTPVVLALALSLAAAKLAGHLAVRMGQPAVLGELVAGVALGSLDLAGIGWFHRIEADAAIDILARLGVVILLFEVGLESTVRDMLKVGRPSVLVALLGVLAVRARLGCQRVASP
jgi:Kef-type K+ transport system membrane component KefB